MKKALLSITAVFIVIAGMLAIIVNRQYLRDLYVINTTNPSASAQALGDTLALTNKGDFLYEASIPELLESTDFNKACGNVTREQSIVLGCYSKQLIYVYDVSDQRLDGVKEVTAAHELLHAVYDRLTSQERDQLNILLGQEETKVTDQRIKDTIAQYKVTEPNDVYNELHSIFGTELTTLSPELEAHYKKYFTNRQKIVRYSQQYEATFTAIEQQIKEYDARLSELKQSINTLEAELRERQQSIEQERQRLDNLRNQNQIDEYNSAVPTYNANIQQYNRDVEQLKLTIEEYNNVVAERNKLAATQNDLVKQLDSKYQKLK